MRLLPGARLVVLLGRRCVDREVHPAVPFGRYLRSLGEVLVDHPAPRHAQRADASALDVVAVALRVGSDQLAAECRVESVRPGVAAPPAEDLAEDAHVCPAVGVSSRGLMTPSEAHCPWQVRRGRTATAS